MDATYRPLEKRYSIYLLVLIYKNPGQSKSWLFNQDGKNLRIKAERLEELHQMGLVRYDDAPRKSNTMYVYTTEAGDILAEALIKITDIVGMKECDPEDY